ncbi:hypothetical protein [Achromobacter dolens]|uniref:hypothetical protein n=1 Tax=Achromobacter dolens TaxID=1287738 RepID=UPI001582B54F|nr:hypothetical protein [Achromobacter dolens]
MTTVDMTSEEDPWKPKTPQEILDDFASLARWFEDDGVMPDMRDQFQSPFPGKPMFPKL